MFKYILPFFVIVFILFLAAGTVKAQTAPSFVTVVNPVRGGEFWDKKDEQPETAVLGELEILKKYNVPATWLIRYDGLKNQNLIFLLKSAPPNHEIGLFLETTPALTEVAKVSYHQSPSWHSAGSVFLSGYSQSDRIKLINTSFSKFKDVFGYFPRSVGAWWIDSYSLDYMQKKYGIVASLEVADQYSTDNYQIWGQYFGIPYYPERGNNLQPAQKNEEKIPVVVMQWAARDPINGYGKAVEESTYSVQANDYLDYHSLNIAYFSKLVDIYTKQPLNQFNQLTVGLENSYSWKKYGSEYQNQVEILVKKKEKGQFDFTTMSRFNDWYKNHFPDLSPRQIIAAADPLGTDASAVWFMSPYYRAGWFYNQEGVAIRDVHQYIEGKKELCFDSPCDEINFATSATRALDDVSFSQRYLLDQGKINSFNINLSDDKLSLNYTNEANLKRNLEFLPRDISVDGKIHSIDGFILDAQTKSLSDVRSKITHNPGRVNSFRDSNFDLLLAIIKFITFLILAVFIPGFVFVTKTERALDKVFLSTVLGLVNLTLVSYLSGFVHFYLLSIVYLVVFNLIFFCKKMYQKITLKVQFRSNILFIILIFSGVIFQTLPTFKSGWVYDFGMGFWGPNGHDGVWHLSLINQLIKGLPIENPIYSGTILKNYHYLYDLLIAITNIITKVNLTNLIFRFYPILFSTLLGIGSYCLAIKLFRSRLATFLAIYLVYFAGSFGWIVEYIREKHFGGESTFWANQSISLNLNPPYAISLILIIAIFLILLGKKNNWLNGLGLILIIGSLIGFKSYGAVLSFGALGTVTIQQVLKGNFFYFRIFITSLLLSLGIFLPNFNYIDQVFIFSPFWLIHSMIDFPDRVGWLKLSQARVAYLNKGSWFKFLIVEAAGLVIFIGGNLGIRIAGLFNLVKSFKKIANPFYLYLTTFSLLSVITPLLFTQKGNGWNIIQFFYYFLFISSIFAGATLALIYKKFPKILGIIIVIGFLIIAPVNSVVTARSYIENPSPHTFIGFSELEALNFLAKEPPGVVLTYPYDKLVKNRITDPRPLFAYDTTAYVSALSQHPTFAEDEIQNDLLGNNYQKRAILEKSFFGGVPLDVKINFLANNNINYIYLLKYFNISLDGNNLHLIKILENSEVTIYKINK